MNTKKTAEALRILMDLRRSNAASPIKNKKKYSRKIKHKNIDKEQKIGDNIYMALIRSKDRKVTNAVSPNGKTATIANTFGLPAGKDFSCPGQTPTCAKVCYAGKLEKIYKGVRDVLLHNWEQLKDADHDTMEALLTDMINEFRKDI